MELEWVKRYQCLVQTEIGIAGLVDKFFFLTHVSVVLPNKCVLGEELIIKFPILNIDRGVFQHSLTRGQLIAGSLYPVVPKAFFNS